MGKKPQPPETNPRIRDARKLAEKYGKQGVIILHFDYAQSRAGYTSYGEPGAAEHQTGEIATLLWNTLNEYVRQRTAMRQEAEKNGKAKTAGPAQVLGLDGNPIAPQNPDPESG